jgi:hypothetical protein
LDEFLCFQHLDVVVFKENSSDIEWRAWGKGYLPFPADMPLEEFPGWHVVNKQEPQVLRGVPLCRFLDKACCLKRLLPAACIGP